MQWGGAQMTTRQKLTVVQTADGKPCIVPQAMHAMLKFISDHPGATYDEIGAHVDWDRPSVNTYASRMEKARLIHRQKRVVDGRVRAQTYLQQGVCLDFEVVTV